MRNEAKGGYERGRQTDRDRDRHTHTRIPDKAGGVVMRDRPDDRTKRKSQANQKKKKL